MNIEVCCNSLYSIRTAEELGASRVELCQNLLEDGITPDLELLKEACQKFEIPIHVLIRPKIENFFYSASELKRIEESIHKAIQFPIAGIVVGHLNRKNGVDPALLRHWRALTRGLDLTFHRAFDRVVKPFNVLEQLIEAGFNRLLSSGQQGNAETGILLLQHLQKVAGNSLEIMPGGGVNDKNVSLFIDAGFKSIHLSAKSSNNPAYLEPVINPTILKNVIMLSSKK
tara:strand:- start:630 stop:1313 length:684 start_codon:yes stop_codon:yes gene_type:complete